MELQGAISVNPIDESGVQIREQINWACGDCIGQGAFGKVMLGLNIVTGELMAVKQVWLSLWIDTFAVAAELLHNTYL